MIKHIKVTEIEAEKKDATGCVLVIDIPYCNDETKVKKMARGMYEKAGSVLGVNHTWKWYKIDSETIRKIGLKADKKIVGMMCHTERDYLVRYKCISNNGEVIDVVRTYKDKIRRRDLQKRFKELLSEEGRYDFVEVVDIKITDTKYWITPEQLIQYGTDVTGAVEMVTNNN